MMSSKRYQEELADLEEGIKSLNKIMAECTDRITYNKAMKNKEVQEARIDFFKRGYNFARRELGGQRTIIEILKMSNQARVKTIKQDIQCTIP